MKDDGSDDLIETTIFTARNRVTGSEIRLETIPIDWRRVDYWYENPNFNLTIGFEARSVSETKLTEIRGRASQWEVTTAEILIEGILRRLIEIAMTKGTEIPIYGGGLGPSSFRKIASIMNDKQKADIVTDCYQLISKHLTSYQRPYYAAHPGTRVQIYEVNENTFHALPRPPHRIGPDAITTSHAKLVF